MSARHDDLQSRMHLLELAAALGNVSRACRILGFSRDTFYRFKQIYGAGGPAALSRVSRHCPRINNRVSPEIEHAAIALAVEQPLWGPVRAANALRAKGHRVSPTGVRGVWQRHALLRRDDRLRARERSVHAS